MANVIVDESSLSGIADAIRSKLGVTTTYLPSEMPDAIESIDTSGSADLGTKSITANGTYTATDDSLDGYSSVTVAVESESATLGTKSITANGTYTASDDSYDGYSEVTVAVEATLGTLSATANGTYTASDDGYDGYSEVTVEVESESATLTTKSITANGTYTASDDSADGYSSVTVAVEGGEWTTEGIAAGTEPNGAITITGTTLGDRAFQGKPITSFTGENVTSIPTAPFAQCSSLTSVSCPVATSIGGSAFYECSSLTSVSCPVATSVGGSAFYGCSSLTGINLASVAWINGTYAFSACTALESIYLPNAVVTSANSNGYTFDGCTSLKTIVLPKSTGLPIYFARNCTSLEVIDILGGSGWANYAVQNCTALATVILRSTSAITALANTNGAIKNSPMVSGGNGVTIYVPSDMISTFEANSNWATVLGYNNTIVAIEGSDYENYYADGTAISS